MTPVKFKTDPDFDLEELRRDRRQLASMRIRISAMSNCDYTKESTIKNDLKDLNANIGTILLSFEKKILAYGEIKEVDVTNV